jgi:hypothetical protein
MFVKVKKMPNRLKFFNTKAKIRGENHQNSFYPALSGKMILEFIVKPPYFPLINP